MALATPYVVIIDGVTFNCERTYVLGSRSEYQDTTGAVKLIVSHKYSGTRVSRLFRVEMKHTAADGSVSKESFHTVNEYDTNKVTAVQAKALEVGVAASKAATTNAIIVKVMGGES